MFVRFDSLSNFFIITFAFFKYVGRNYYDGTSTTNTNTNTTATNRNHTTVLDIVIIIIHSEIKVLLFPTFVGNFGGSIIQNGPIDCILWIQCLSGRGCGRR